jgi:winged helix DNA-binding protein
MAWMRHVTDDQRRARLAVRHALAPACRVASAPAVTEAMTALHATEPATVYLSCRARMDAFKAAELDQALYAERCLVKQLAMRRTLFVFPADLLPAVWPSTSARVAGSQRARLAKQIVRAGLAEDGGAWLDRAGAEVLAALADAPDGRTAQELRDAVPLIDVKVALSANEMFSMTSVLVYLGVTAAIVRGTNTGRWYTSRPRWTLTRHWLGDVPPWLPAADGYRELVRRWLYTFGPGTEDDIVWWLGATKTIVRAALAGLDAVPGVAGRRRHRLAAARRRRRPARPRSVGGAAAGAGSDRDGLAGPRFLSRPARRPTVRQPGQRRHDGVGGRQGGRILDPGRVRRGGGAAAGPGPGGHPPRPGRRSGPPDRVAGRPAGG